MYGTSGMTAASGAGATTLAMTGVDSLWMVIAAVTMLTVGTVIMQIVPRKEH